MRCLDTVWIFLVLAMVAMVWEMDERAFARQSDASRHRRRRWRVFDERV